MQLSTQIQIQIKIQKALHVPRTTSARKSLGIRRTSSTLFVFLATSASFRRPQQRNMFTLFNVQEYNIWLWYLETTFVQYAVPSFRLHQDYYNMGDGFSFHTLIPRPSQVPRTSCVSWGIWQTMRKWERRISAIKFWGNKLRMNEEIVKSLQLSS